MAAQEFVESLQQGAIANLLSADDSRLVRDEFNTRKMILAVTARGKVSFLHQIHPSW